MRFLKAILTSFIILCISTAIPVFAEPFILVLDAGHGGKDPGAVNGKAQEKNINLNVALRAGKLIEENCKDVKVLYTRKTDTFVELSKRADIANKADADMFISIHTNAAKNTSAYGAETFLLGVEENRTSANFNVAIEENKAILYESDYETTYAGYDPNSSESQIIFEFMQNEHQKESLKMASITQNRLTSTAKRHNRGVHQAGFLVLWRSAMPSILIELGFISNSNDMKYMTSQKGVEELSQSIYLAFNEYLEETRKAQNKTTQIGLNSNQNKDTESANPSRPVFKVQFLTSKSVLGKKDSRLENLQDISYYKDNGLYKYTCGETTDYNRILEIKKEVAKRYKDAFIVAFIDNKRVSIDEARRWSDK
ncbi:MAG: N-acetylmuramoyl-L-alanine amidase [Bacteroidaceae bacterium]|nr:N-acetylmuramoyl-L-alanine amidase [Bacteroidaceae bacterium]